MRSILKKRYEHFKVGGGHFEVVIDQCSVVTPRPWIFQVPLGLAILK